MKAQYWIILLLGLIIACTKSTDDGDLSHIPYDPLPRDIALPEKFPQMEIPADNPTTREGVELGRRLFYDPKLSDRGIMSCSTCHLPEGSFTDNLALSRGVRGEEGKRSSMSLLNVGLNNEGFFWDGRVKSLEEQALLPVQDPIELHESWPNVIEKLKADAQYPSMFRKAFGITDRDSITKELAAKAIAQFERTLVSSGKSKYDRVVAGDDIFTDQELRGFQIFFDIDPDMTKHAECGHCHNAPLFTTNEFLNNGIEDVADLADFPDLGRGEFTGHRKDFGQFRVPTLRNVLYTAPYMHDGRFETLDEVIDHYVTGGHVVDNISPIMRPLDLSADDRAALIAFITTLSDEDFLNDPRHQSPF